MPCSALFVEQNGPAMLLNHFQVAQMDGETDFKLPNKGQGCYRGLHSFPWAFRDVTDPLSKQLQGLLFSMVLKAWAF